MVTVKLFSLFCKRYLFINFFVAFLISVIRLMGPGFTYVPGDLTDNRFNNFILEHFYLWVIGTDSSYWSAAIFYPFPNTIAFSDNLLGTAPLYAGVRALGLDRETAFQVWYTLGHLILGINVVFSLHFVEHLVKR